MKYLKYLFVLLLSINYVPFNDAYKILGVFASSSTSHTLLGSELLKSLAERGHEVTMISGNPLKKPFKNYRDIPVSFDIKKVSLNLSGEVNYFQKGQTFGLKTIINFFRSGLTVTELIINDPNFQKLLNSNEHFDAVIVVTFTYEATFAIAHHFKAPLIIYSQVGPTMITNDLVGNPNNYAYVPDWILGYTDHMSFKERVLNTLMGTMFEIIRYGFYLPKQNEITQRLFPNGANLYDIMKNVSLILSNSHVSVSYPQPFVPNMIEIGGHHVKDPKPLPSDIQKYMDEAPYGVIYFSLGSNIRSTDLTPDLRNTILEVFSKLPQRILWKWETDTLPGKPENVFINKWFPQNDILAHPNLKLFITHGGWGSTVEAIVRGVPLIGIPGIADQRMNTKKSAQMGFGILLEFSNITVESFSWALNEVLNNPRYRKAIKERSTLFLDREISPTDRAIYWIEYVIRNKGAHHLQTAAIHLNRVQLLLLDVVGFFIVIILTFVLALYSVCRFVKRKFFKSKSNTQIKQKTN